MTRLTNSIQEQLTTELLKYKFSDKAQELVEKQSTFAHKIYNDCFDKKTRDKMKRLPQGWLPEVGEVSVEFASKFTRLEFNGGNNLSWNYRFLFKKSFEAQNKRFPNKHKSNCVKQYTALDKLALEYTQIQNEISDFTTAISHTKANIQSAFSSCTTVEKLIKNWKEIEPFAKKYVEVKGTNLPALPTEQLNKLLNLPVGK